MFSTEDWRAAGAAQLDDAARVLGSVFGTVPGHGPVIDRRPWPLEGTFDAEVVTCRTATGDIRQVYCKHGPDIDLTDPHAAYGQRGGLGREAAVYTYVLDTDPDDLVVTFRDVWVVGEDPVNPGGGVGPADHPRLITLTTCAELFHTDDRMVAFGHLVSAESKDGAAS